MKSFIHIPALFFWAVLLLLTVFPRYFIVSESRATEIQKPVAAVIVSRNIKPYMEAVGGLSFTIKEQGKIDLRTFFLDRYRENEWKALQAQLKSETFDFYIAVGPESARFVTAMLPQGTRIFYTMILNPEKLLPNSEVVCGVSMDIPVGDQVKEIHKRLPFVKRVGLLYDPKYNADFLDAAQTEHGFLEVIPLAVESKRQIPLVLNRYLEKIDGIWMIPDRTVISESIVKYIIKSGILKKKPVIGYNPFFYESGAAMAFVLDYEKLGIQTANVIIAAQAGVDCRKSPVFDTLLNKRVLQKIGIEP